MKALLQRVSQSSVSVDNQIISSIENGLLVLLGIEKEDTPAQAAALCKKIANLRIFEDDQDKMNLSIMDVHGEILIISQFTLMANTKKGNRPSFVDAAPPEIAKPLIRVFCNTMQEYGIPVKEGVFGAHMQVALINDGPVTIWLEN